MSAPGTQPAAGQLRWRCRRGMKELDLLLTRYVDQCYAAAPAAEQTAFRQLLELQDPLLYAFCMGRETPPASLSPIIKALLGTVANDR